jgi:hypothetical protein
MEKYIMPKPEYERVAERLAVKQWLLVLGNNATTGFGQFQSLGIQFQLSYI